MPQAIQPLPVDGAKVLIAGLFTVLCAVLTFWAYYVLQGFNSDQAMLMVVVVVASIGMPSFMVAIEWHRKS